eukprot:Nk52_evm9s167 gene=Nk52_evmTU9s167
MLVRRILHCADRANGGKQVKKINGKGKLNFTLVITLLLAAIGQGSGASKSLKIAFSGDRISTVEYENGFKAGVTHFANIIPGHELMAGTSTGDWTYSFNDKGSDTLAILNALDSLNQGVTCLVGGFQSSISQAINLMLSHKGMVQVSGSSTNVLLSLKGNHPTFLRTIGLDSEQFTLLADAIHYFGWPKCGLILVDNSYGQGGAQFFRNRTNELGIEIIQSAIFPEDIVRLGFDVTKALKDMKEKGVKVIATSFQAPDAIPVLEAAYDLGMVGEDYVWLGTDGWLHSGFTNGLKEGYAEKIVPGVLGTVPGRNESTSRFQDFAAAYKKVTGSSTVTDNSFATYAFDAVGLLATALGDTIKELDGLGLSSDCLQDALSLTSACKLSKTQQDQILADASCTNGSSDCVKANGVISFMTSLKANENDTYGVNAPKAQTLLLLKTYRAKYNGTTGPMQMSENGDAIGFFSLANGRFKSSSARSRKTNGSKAVSLVEFVVIGGLSVTSSPRVLINDGVKIVYGGGNATHPNLEKPSISEGGSVAPSDSSDDNMMIYIVVAVLGFALVLAAIGGYYTYTYFQQEKAFQMKSWHIDVSELDNWERGGGEDTMSFTSQADREGTYYHGIRVTLDEVVTKNFSPNRETTRSIVYLSGLRHTNLCNFVGVVTDGDETFIVMEFCSKGALSHVLNSKKNLLDWSFRYSFMFDILSGLQHLHNSEFSHGHLSPKSCMVDGMWNCKLTGYFGKVPELCPEFAVESRFDLVLRTPPEDLVLFSTTGAQRSSIEGDIYAFGILLIEISLCELIDGDSNQAEYLLEDRLASHFIPDQVSEIGTLLRKLIESCLVERPLSRASISVLLKKLRVLCPNARSGAKGKYELLEAYSRQLEEEIRESKFNIEMKERVLRKAMEKIFPPFILRTKKPLEEGKPIVYENTTLGFLSVTGVDKMARKISIQRFAESLQNLMHAVEEQVESHLLITTTCGRDEFCFSNLPNRKEAGSFVLFMDAVISRISDEKRSNSPLLGDINAQGHLCEGDVIAGMVGVIKPVFKLYGDAYETGYQALLRLPKDRSILTCSPSFQSCLAGKDKTLQMAFSLMDDGVNIEIVVQEGFYGGAVTRSSKLSVGNFASFAFSQSIGSPNGSNLVLRDFKEDNVDVQLRELQMYDEDLSRRD